MIPTQSTLGKLLCLNSVIDNYFIFICPPCSFRPPTLTRHAQPITFE